MAVHPGVFAFLDLEATRNDGESDWGDPTEDGFDDFLDDDNDMDADTLIRSTTVQDPSAPDAFEQWTNELLARHTSKDVADSQTSKEEGMLSEDAAKVNVALPMWRIQCFLGWEERLCSSIRAHQPPQCKDDVAFSMRNMPGWAYWSCDMQSMHNYIVKQYDLPGAVRKNGKPTMISVDDKESVVTWWGRRAPHLSRGSWVRAVKGKFRGAIGVITATSSVCASVLLIPFADWSSPILAPGKRSREPSWANPRLFDRTDAKVREVVDSIREGVQTHSALLLAVDEADSKYRYRGVTYWHGLAVVLIPQKHLSRDVGSIDVTIADLFKASGHPIINVNTMPCCIDWVFYADEHVRSLSTNVEGVVEEVHDHGLLVKTASSEETTLAWHNVEKVFYVGDYVRVLSSTGKKGWVQDVENVQAHVLFVEKGEGERPVCAETHVYHINSLTLTSNEDVSRPLRLADDIYSRATTTGRTPWLNVSATITLKGHPLRNYPAIVKDVLIGQDTESGLQLLLEITTYNAANPRRTQKMDYDHVVDPETQWHLQFRYPLRPNQKAYFPQKQYTRNKLARPIPAPQPILVMNGGQTPAPDITESTSPAWDPRIHDSPPPPPDVPWVLNGAFVGYALRLSPPNSTKVIVGIPTKHGGTIILNTIYRRTLKEIEASGLEARHPGARWAGPLMVIAGSDIGKYVRPIRQRTIEGVVQWTVQVCDRKKAEMDVLVDEELVIRSTWLCEVYETEEERKLNEDQARQLKEPAAGHGF